MHMANPITSDQSVANSVRLWPAHPKSNMSMAWVNNRSQGSPENRFAPSLGVY